MDSQNQSSSVSSPLHGIHDRRKFLIIIVVVALVIVGWIMYKQYSSQTPFTLEQRQEAIAKRMDAAIAAPSTITDQQKQIIQNRMDAAIAAAASGGATKPKNIPVTPELTQAQKDAIAQRMETQIQAQQQ